MLDIRMIRENPKLVEVDLLKRGDKEKIRMLHELVRLDMERRKTIQHAESQKHLRNRITGEISQSKAGKKPAKKIKEAKELGGRIKRLDEKLAELEKQCNLLLMGLPNMLHSSVPTGKDDSNNVEIRRFGKREWKFQPKNHAEILESLGLIDSERAAKVAGHGFHYLKNELAILDYALQRLALDFLMKKGFTVTEPPFMLQRKPYEGVVDISDFGGVMYKIENEDLYLIATSEHPMAAMFCNETLMKDSLPIRLAGVSPCFRKEVGAHGKYTRGLFRMHHFNKVEQFVFCLPGESWQLHEELQRNSEELYESLELACRVVNVCTGDIGTIAAKKYDTEFLMADGNYREIGSNSNCTDYQARRLNIKYREKEGLPPSGFVHTLNNTAIATSRTMIAIIEQHQMEDGSVDIPRALWPYTGFRKLEKKAG